MTATNAEDAMSYRRWPALLLMIAALTVMSPAMAMPRTTLRPVAAAKAVAPVAGPCPRYAQGAQVLTPPAKYSGNGLLNVAFSFQQRTDSKGRTLYCFMTPDGMSNPVLHVKPGDTLYLTLTNNTQTGSASMTIDPPNCNPNGDTYMNSTSVNLHYHGTNTSPQCGGDEVIKTVINYGETMTYRIDFPTDEPPGLYWYHPHVHGYSDAMVTGGATGALIVDGIEQFQPSVAGLPQQTIVLRDQHQLDNIPENNGSCVVDVPFRDITVNDVPVNSYRTTAGIVFAPASLTVIAGQPQFWRMANTSADSILDLSLVYDGVPQTLYVVAIDGVPVNSQDGVGAGGSPVAVQHFRLPPASRVEFVAAMPALTVKRAQLMTQNIDTGSAGDCDPTRALITINPRPIVSAALTTTVPARPIPAGAGRRFAGLAQVPVTAQRTVYFSEDGENFYMTVLGQTPHRFSPNDPPSITTTQGAVEQWTVQNQSYENHEFHIHQIHFLVQSQDNFGGEPAAPGIVGQYLDTVEVPAWAGPGNPYPSVTLLMDFRGAVVGNFVFHCHILNHEDQGMMSIIQVNPPPNAPRARGKRAAAAQVPAPAPVMEAMKGM